MKQEWELLYSYFKEKKMYYLGVILGIVLSVPAIIWWNYFTLSIFNVKVYHDLSSNEIYYSCLALIGVGTIVYLIGMLIVDFVDKNKE